MSSLYVILVELVIWIYLFLRFSKDMSYYRAMLFADFIITTIDFILLATPYRTTLLNIVLYNKATSKPIAVIPVTFGAFLLLKSILFYTFQELLPGWFFKKPVATTPTLERGEDEHGTAGST